MKFVLVLHGETNPDSSLTVTGRRQAQAAGANLSAPYVTATVISSPAAEATEAAAIIGGALGVEAPQTRTELAAPLEGSPLTEHQEAAWAIIEAAKTDLDPDATLVMVTHDAVIRLLVCRALGMPLQEMHRFALEPGSMTTIEWRTQPRERLLIASLNEVCHLETQTTTTG